MTISSTETVEEAIRQGYVIHKVGVESAEVANEYFDWCKKKGKPYLSLNPMRKYVSVYLDRITVNRVEIDNPALMEELKRVQEDAIQYLRSTGWLKPHGSLSSGGGYILEEHAIEVALRLGEMYSPLYKK